MLVTHRANLATIAVVLLGCASGGAKPPVAEPTPSASSEPAAPVFSWVGHWSALSGAVQDGADIVMDDGGRFKAVVVYGPEQKCCVQGTYHPKNDEITFTVAHSTCNATAFTEYTRIYQRSPDKVVLAQPGNEEHITKGADGELEGPVWTFTRSSEPSSIPDCHG